MVILVLQSSWWGRESWLLCLICFPGVSWWLSGSSSRCHGVVCGLWLWYFLIILTYYFCKILKCHITERTSDGGNGNHSVSLPIIFLKIKVDHMLPSSYISSLLVSILWLFIWFPISMNVWLYFGAKTVTFCIIHIGNRKKTSPPPPESELILLHVSVFS